MRKGFLIAAPAILAIAAISFLRRDNSVNLSSGVGPDLELIEMEQKGSEKTWHWRDRRTGGCVYSHDELAGLVWDEPCE